MFFIVSHRLPDIRTMPIPIRDGKPLVEFSK